MLTRKALATILALATYVYAQGNTWNRVRYNGGTVQTKVDYKDWDNKLTITSDLITFQLKDRQSVEIPTSSVTGLSYGQEAHRRVGTMIALGILVLPSPCLACSIRQDCTSLVLNKARVLLLSSGVLMALKSATGAPLAVAAEDRKYVPTGIHATVVAGHEEEASETRPASPPPRQTVAQGVAAGASSAGGSSLASCRNGKNRKALTS